ncbi:hypothetical protein ACOBV8_00755 [Pseudoalteromonas espejiana]
MKSNTKTTPALFHEGELTIQQKLGKKEQVASFAKRAVRSFMPEQHQLFFRNCLLLWLVA